MILFDLKCAEGHVFEAWFKDGKAFTAQSEAGEIACPICGGRDIAKAPMAPQLARRRPGKASASASEPEGERSAAAKQVLEALHRKVEEHCDFVGKDFAEEARKIHYGEVEKHGIYGEATDVEATDLEEEGIEFHRLPSLPQSDA